MYRMLLICAVGFIAGGNVRSQAAENAPTTLEVSLDGAHVPRTWSDRSGKHQVIATYLESDGENVRLQKASGAQVNVPLSKLSSFDQHWVASLTSAEPAAANTENKTARYVANVWQQLGLAELPQRVTQAVTPAAETRELVRDVQANAVYIQVSESFLNRLIPRKHTYREPIRDVILAAQVHGHGHTQSTVRVDLVPSGKCAVSDLLVSGRCDSQTTSYAGPVQVHGHGTTLFSSRTRVTADDQRLVVLPTVSAARSHNVTDSITSSLPRLRGKISLRIAEDRVAEQHGQIEAISARHAEQRVNRKVDQLVSRSISQLPPAVQAALVGGKTGLPMRLVSHSTDDRLHVSLLPKDAAILAQLPAPPENDHSADVVVQIHSPLLNRALARVDMKDAVRRALAKTAKTSVMQLVSTKAAAAPHWTLRWSGDHRWVTFTWSQQPSERRAVIDDKVAVAP